ncbi:MAG: BtrH N-terminal domain-containing protein [Candidatus Latescibacteria bacterium]|nr:BtrH N-terminal domain-containing protein [Candidatus Latescibacterota bacterium]
MRRSIPDVPFSDGDHYPCDLVALDAMLQFHGYATPLVIHDQWFLFYGRRDSGARRLHPRFFPLEATLSVWGIRAIHHHEPDGETAWCRVRARIDEGHPVPVLADTYHLEALYYPGWGNHTGHSIILCGYDDPGRTVDLVDPSPSKRHRGTHPLPGLMDAWGSNAIVPYTWMEFQPPDTPRELGAKEAVLTVVRNVQLMAGQVPSPAGGHIGIAALLALEQDLDGWSCLEPEDQRSRLMVLYEDLLPVVREREGHAAYLRLAGGGLGIPDMAESGDHLRALAQKWLVLRNLCLKARRRPLEPVMERLRMRLREIVELEERTLTHLKGWLGGPLNSD